jgi:ferredoxin-nitrite reductase
MQSRVTIIALAHVVYPCAAAGLFTVRTAPHNAAPVAQVSAWPLGLPVVQEEASVSPLPIGLPVAAVPAPEFRQAPPARQTDRALAWAAAFVSLSVAYLAVGGERPTGTSFLPDDTIERIKEEGNKIEKIKMEKDGTHAWDDIYEFAAAVRSGEMDYKDISKDDMDFRLKWNGLLSRFKRTKGKFMMRLRTPNGIVNSTLMRFYADRVEPYGDIGVIDITTRQNIQLRGMTLEDGADILKGLHELGQTSIQSALDNIRNTVGSPLAGIDENELVDTRPYCEAINDLICKNKETGEYGNPQWGNLPRKFNIAVSGSRDDFSHTYINDIGLDPCPHATTGEMGFNVKLGGYMSIKRVAESLLLDMWVPADPAGEDVTHVVTLCEAILRIFRDEGHRGDRQKARLIWLIEKYGVPEFRAKLVEEIESYGRGARHDFSQPEPEEEYERRDSLLGTAPQPDGRVRVGIHVPAGRLYPLEARAVAELADKYCAGEIRMTVEQNLLLPNVDADKLEALMAEPCLNGDSRLAVDPGNVVGSMVSCTGAQFCPLAMIETKLPAEKIIKALDKKIVTSKPLRIHFTGCPNSCAQVQAADIGLMGGPAKKEIDGKMKAVPGVTIYVGGTVGEHGHLSTEPYQKGVPMAEEDLVPALVKIAVEKFGATEVGANESGASQGVILTEDAADAEAGADGDQADAVPKAKAAAEAKPTAELKAKAETEEKDTSDANAEAKVAAPAVVAMPPKGFEWSTVAELAP